MQTEFAFVSVLCVDEEQNKEKKRTEKLSIVIYNV